MEVPTSEVGYTSATTGRGDHEVHKGHVVALEKKSRCNDRLHFRLVFKFCTVIYYTILDRCQYGCETWSLIFRKERSLRVFENRMLRIFGPKRARYQGSGEYFKMRSSMICIP